MAITFQNATPFAHDVLSDVVLCSQSVSGSANVLIAAPGGVTLVNGVLTPAVTVVAAGPATLLSTVVTHGQVINQGTIPVNIFVAGVTAPIPAQIPWTDTVACSCCNPGDDITKTNFTVSGIAVSGVVVSGTLFLSITAAFSYCFICSQRRVLTVLATEGC